MKWEKQVTYRRKNKLSPRRALSRVKHKPDGDLTYATLTQLVHLFRPKSRSFPKPNEADLLPKPKQTATKWRDRSRSVTVAAAVGTAFTSPAT